MADHGLSKVLVGMRSPSVNPETKQYSTMHDNTTLPAETQMQKYYEKDPIEVNATEPKSFEPVTEAEKEMRVIEFDENRHLLTTQFYKKLQDLKNEHNKTLDMLQKLYDNADHRFDFHSDTSEYNGKSAFITQNRTNVYKSHDEENYRRVRETEQMKNLRENYKNMEFSPEVKLDKQPTKRIDEMWNEFKMRDYITPDLVRVKKDKSKERPKSAPVVKKEWKPIVTIPEPFSMTIREEQKKEKLHTRSSKEVADEWKKKQLEAELESEKRIRAQEPPAHTFLPLYEEIVERQKQRSTMNREHAALALKSIIQPFSFTEADEKKREEMKRHEKLQSKKELRKIKKMTQFVANPIPSSVHDPSIDQKLQENELYRQIKIKLRSEDTMRASALPSRMEAHKLMEEQRRKTKHKYNKQQNFSFRPKTIDVPDFKRLHKKDAIEMYARKTENMNTMTEPFNLRTLSRGEQRRAMKEALESLKQEEEEFNHSMNNLNRKITIAQSESIPQRMTESARLRILKTRKELEKAEQDLQQLKEEENRRKIRHKQMAERVLNRSSLNSDPDEIDVTAAKVKENKKKIRLRDKEYARELREMKERVDKSPFLFEQHSLKAAAQKKNREIEKLENDLDLSGNYKHSTPLKSSDEFQYSNDEDFSDSVQDDSSAEDKTVKKLEFE